MALKAIDAVEAVLQELLERRLRAGERSKAIPNVSRWQHAELSSKASGAPAVVGDCNNSRNCVGGVGSFMRVRAKTFEYGR